MSAWGSVYYLFEGLQSVCIHFSDIVGLCDSIEVFADRVDIHQAVVCYLNTFEVSEEPTQDTHWS